MQTEAADGIVARLRAGDHETFNALVTEYFPRLVGMAYKKFHDLTLAEDMAQETLLRLWTGRVKIESDAHIHPHLFRVATCRCIDELRRRERRQPQTDQISHEEQVEMRVQLAEVMDRIPAGYRQLIHWKANGFRLREMAESLGVPLGTVKSRLHSAQKTARVKSAELGWSEPA